jgi:hypothetical protein
VDGADDSGPQGPELLGPQVQRVPKFKIMKENGSRRVILADRRHKDTRGAWEYFAEPGRAFDTCCFKAVAGDERLRLRAPPEAMCVDTALEAWDGGKKLTDLLSWTTNS